MPPLHPRRLPRPIAVAGAVLVGVLTATQTQINGALGAAIGDALTAAALSFGSGFVILLALSSLLPAGRAGVVRLIGGVRERRIPVWMILGGGAGGRPDRQVVQVTKGDVLPDLVCAGHMAHRVSARLIGPRSLCT